MEYEEREDEFDIVSAFLSVLVAPHGSLELHPQEDEAEQLKRKRAAEEQDVDVTLDTTEPADEARYSVNYGMDDEDVAWADDEPDDDLPGWRLKVIMEDENDMM